MMALLEPQKKGRNGPPSQRIQKPTGHVIVFPFAWFEISTTNKGRIKKKAPLRRCNNGKVSRSAGYLWRGIRLGGDGPKRERAITHKDGGHADLKESTFHDESWIIVELDDEVKS